MIFNIEEVGGKKRQRVLSHREANGTTGNTNVSQKKIKSEFETAKVAGT